MEVGGGRIGGEDWRWRNRDEVGYEKGEKEKGVLKSCDISVRGSGWYIVMREINDFEHLGCGGRLSSRVRSGFLVLH